MDLIREHIQQHPAELVEAYQNRTPLSRLEIEVRLDWRCNAKCKFCGVWKYSRDGMLPPEEWRRIFTELHTAGLSYVLFTGGEPMLYPDFFPVIEHVDALGVQTGIITNGSLLDQARVERLGRLAGLRGITVSLDSPDPAVHDEVRKMRGLFNRAMAGMARVKQQLPEVMLTVNTVVSADTVGTVKDLLTLPVLPHRLRVFPVGLDMPWLDSLATVTENDWAPWAAEAKTQVLPAEVWAQARAELDALRDESQRLGVHLEYERLDFAGPYQGYCVVPHGHLVLQPDGDAYPCCHVQDRRNRIGQLGTQSVSQMFSGEPYRGFLSSLRPATLPACRSCSRYRAFNHTATALLADAGVVTS